MQCRLSQDDVFSHFASKITHLIMCFFIWMQFIRNWQAYLIVWQQFQLVPPHSTQLLRTWHHFPITWHTYFSFETYVYPLTCFIQTFYHSSDQSRSQLTCIYHKWANSICIWHHVPVTWNASRLLTTIVALRVYRAATKISIATFCHSRENYFDIQEKNVWSCERFVL